MSVIRTEGYHAAPSYWDRDQLAFSNSTEVDGRQVSYHKVTVQRTYRDGDEFKTTTSYGRDDLPIVSLLVARAWEFILDAEAARGSE